MKLLLYSLNCIKHPPSPKKKIQIKIIKKIIKYTDLLKNEILLRVLSQINYKNDLTVNLYWENSKYINIYIKIFPNLYF